MKKLLILLCALAPVSAVLAQTVPPLMNYQGRLTDENSNPLSNGNYLLAFKLYTNAISGNSIWSETQAVDLVQGNFNVILGTTNTTLTNAFNGPNRYLELTVVRDAAGSNVNRTILPRQQILSTPFAFEAGRAGVAESLNPAYLAGPLAATVLGTVPKRQVFTSNGSWTAPTNLSSPFVILWGSGGGGGGGGGGGDPITGSGTGVGGGGGGGGGSAPAFRLVAVTPGATYSITIGPGGSGGAGGSITTSGSSGNNGGSTTVGNLAIFWGGVGGGGGAVGQTNGLAPAGGGGWSNGVGGNGGNGANGSGSGGQSGQNSPYAAGGARGSGPDGRGGGGGGGIGSGANGGNHTGGSNGGPGQPAAASTGGGGGGGSGGAGGRAGGSGGAGGSGYLEIMWFAPQ